MSSKIGYDFYSEKDSDKLLLCKGCNKLIRAKNSFPSSIHTKGYSCYAVCKECHQKEEQDEKAKI